MQYSTERKEAVLRKKVPPHNRSIKQLAREEGISEATLFYWRSKACEKKLLLPDSNSGPENWSSRDKFTAVVETAALNETELAEYCRKKGIYPQPMCCQPFLYVPLCLCHLVPEQLLRNKLRHPQISDMVFVDTPRRARVRSMVGKESLNSSFFYLPRNKTLFLLLFQGRAVIFCNISSFHHFCTSRPIPLCFPKC